MLIIIAGAAVLCLLRGIRMEGLMFINMHDRC
jgi:hypothetical protein